MGSKKTRYYHDPHDRSITISIAGTGEIVGHSESGTGSVKWNTAGNADKGAARTPQGGYMPPAAGHPLSPGGPNRVWQSYQTPYADAMARQGNGCYVNPLSPGGPNREYQQQKLEQTRMELQQARAERNSAQAVYRASPRRPKGDNSKHNAAQRRYQEAQARVDALEKKYRSLGGISDLERVGRAALGTIEDIGANIGTLIAAGYDIAGRYANSANVKPGDSVSKSIDDPYVYNQSPAAKASYEWADKVGEYADQNFARAAEGANDTERAALTGIRMATRIGSEVGLNKLIPGSALYVRAADNAGMMARSYRNQSGETYDPMLAMGVGIVAGSGTMLAGEVSKGVDKAGVGLLGKLGVQNLRAADTLVGGAAASGYALTEGGARELARALADENYSPDWSQIGSEAIEAFAFGAITRCISTARVSRENKAKMQRMNRDAEKAYQDWKRMFNDPGVSSELRAEAAARAYNATYDMDDALSALRVVGAQSEVDAIHGCMSAIRGELTPYLPDATATSSGFLGTGGMVPYAGSTSLAARQSAGRAASAAAEAAKPSILLPVTPAGLKSGAYGGIGAELQRRGTGGGRHGSPRGRDGGSRVDCGEFDPRTEQKGGSAKKSL